MISVDNDTIRFLIIDASEQAAESLLNLFRESGYSTRATHVSSEDELEEALSGRWDLLLISDIATFAGFQQIFALVNKKDVDLPVIVLSDPDEDHLTLLKMGARAVVPAGHDEYLLNVVQKEMTDLKTRRHHRRMSVALYESEKQRRLLLDDQVDAIVYVNQGRIQYANSAFLTLLGVPGEESVDGLAFRDLIAAADQQDVEQFLTGVEESGQALSAIQCSLVARDNSEIPIRAVICATSFNGEFTLSLQINLFESAVHNPEQRSSENDVRLVESGEFDQSLDVAIQRAVSGKNKAALCCIHVENFKAIDEQHGKSVSEKYLTMVAYKLAVLFTSAQPLTSIGAGNFAVLLRDGQEQEVKRQVDSVLSDSVQRDMTIEGHLLSVKLSLGAVLLNENSSDANRLMLYARQATVQAQKNGGNQLVIYQKPKIDSVRAATRQLAGMVSQAMKTRQLRLSYQPVICLAGSPSEYYEASFCMTDTQGREHQAAVLRPKLEKTALWSKLDRWQLIEATKGLIAKRSHGSDTRLLVHVGGFSVTDNTFLPWLQTALKQASIPAEAISIQLSEQNLTRYPQEVSDFLAGLNAIGCQSVISGFGCSLNPLEAIANQKVDWVKLDRSFAEGLRKDGDTQELQKILAALGKTGKKVVVPDIESAVEMAPVWQFGADFIQGSYVSAPADTMDFDFGSDS